MKKNLHYYTILPFYFASLLLVASFAKKEQQNTPVSAAYAFECNFPVIDTLESTKDTICPGEVIFLTVTGELNDAENWHWYPEKCGDTIPAGVGRLITVFPSETTTYFLRPEGGCVETQVDCDSIT
ncbi:MAG: hypothetical protein AAFO07_14600, partial [Bacteroidota bacterium]